MLKQKITRIILELQCLYMMNLNCSSILAALIEGNVITYQWRIQDLPEVGAPMKKKAIIWSIFSQKLYEIERILTLEGASLASPPLRCANAYLVQT